MERPKKLRRFTCKKCGEISMATGGSCNYQCISCRTVDGVDSYNTPQRIAHKAVSAAVQSGQIPRASTHKCADCGCQAVAYDHRDYSKPLQIDPVCKRCNALRGPAIGQPPRRKRTTHQLYSQKTLESKAEFPTKEAV